MKVAIVDDEEAYINYLKETIEAACKKEHLKVEIETYRSGQYFSYDIQEGKYYDLYLLDIEMPHINGLDLAKMIRTKFKNSYIVFITSHLKYSLEAFEYNAFRYVKKEDIKSKLPEIIMKIYSLICESEANCYTIITNNRYEKVLLKEVLYIYREGNNSVFVTESGWKTKIRKGLKIIFRELDSEDFFFVDRGMLVNIRHVIRLNNNILTLSNKESLLVSRPHLTDVKEKIFKCWSEKF
nr:LytTR family DNA-binding domain-containing protein [uncultured Blautia sp.]